MATCNKNFETFFYKEPIHRNNLCSSENDCKFKNKSYRKQNEIIHTFPLSLQQWWLSTPFGQWYSASNTTAISTTTSSIT